MLRHKYTKKRLRSKYNRKKRTRKHGGTKNPKKRISEAKRKEAERLDEILQPIHSSMFIESNPSPVKYAAKLLSLCEDDVRLPLVKVTEPTKELIKKALQSAKLI